MSHSQKISSFNTQSLLSSTDLFTLVRNGTNLNIRFSDFQTSLGVTGSITQVGDPLGVPVLNTPSTNTYNIRNMEDGAGIAFNVSAQDGIICKWNIAQDAT